MSSTWFTERVDAAERVFLAAAERARARVERYPHPVSGPHGEALSTLVARVGPDSPDRMVVLVSGTHGIEGHTGAAIQSAFLAERAHALPAGLGVLVIHLIAPWGCAWSRREDAGNLDVFRNLLYAHPPYAENPLYDRYEAGINPRAWEGPERAAADRIYEAFVAEHGLDVVVATVRRGQHRHPRGITYHGIGPGWSYLVADRIGRQHLRDLQRVDVLDIHTGFGAYGEGLVLPCDAPGPLRERVERLYADWLYQWGRDALLPAHPRGPYELWKAYAVADGLSTLGLEYGTYDVGERFDLFRASTCIHAYGRLDDELGRRITAEYRELFYPARAEWRTRVLEQGLEAIRRLVDAG